MSNELDKIKHSKRRYRNQSVIKKQLDIAKSMGVTVEEPHKLLKHHALDCGVSDCPMCSSPRKRFGERSIQERRFYQERLRQEDV
ncbi:hypothetical protein EBU95_15645 [bacterium]|nr:hypothetical protein [bacterium]